MLKRIHLRGEPIELQEHFDHWSLLKICKKRAIECKSKPHKLSHGGQGDKLFLKIK